jgi:hypothetical protein
MGFSGTNDDSLEVGRVHGKAEFFFLTHAMQERLNSAGECSPHDEQTTPNLWPVCMAPQHVCGAKETRRRAGL